MPSAEKDPVSGSEIPTFIGWAVLLALVLALVLPQPAATSAVTAVAAANGTKLRRVGRLINLLPSCDHAEAPVCPGARSAHGTVCLYRPGKARFAPIQGPVPCAAPRTAFLLDPIYRDVLSSTSWAWG